MTTDDPTGDDGIGQLAVRACETESAERLAGPLRNGALMALIVGGNKGPEAEQVLAVIRENPHAASEACRREYDRLRSDDQQALDAVVAQQTREMILTSARLAWDTPDASTATPKPSTRTASRSSPRSSRSTSTKPARALSDDQRARTRSPRGAGVHGPPARSFIEHVMDAIARQEEGPPAGERILRFDYHELLIDTPELVDRTEGPLTDPGTETSYLLAAIISEAMAYVFDDEDS